MRDNVEYLSFLDKIECPTTEDINDFFRILSHLLKRQANMNRWKGIVPENITSYANLETDEYGVKLEYWHQYYRITTGVRFKISSSTGQFYLFFKQLNLSGFSDRKDGVDSLVLISGEISGKNPKCKYLYKGLNAATSKIYLQYPTSSKNAPSLIEIKITPIKGYSIFFQEICKFLDFIIPLFSEEENTKARIATPQAPEPTISSNHESFIYNFPPHFLSFKEDTESIEEIFNKPHGITCEYDEEPPF